MCLTPQGSEASATEVQAELEHQQDGEGHPGQDPQGGAPPQPASWLDEPQELPQGSIAVLNVGGRQVRTDWCGHTTEALWAAVVDEPMATTLQQALPEELSRMAKLWRDTLIWGVPGTPG